MIMHHVAFLRKRPTEKKRADVSASVTDRAAPPRERSAEHRAMFSRSKTRMTSAVLAFVVAGASFAVVVGGGPPARPRARFGTRYPTKSPGRLPRALRARSLFVDRD
jgi:hypothetical protein